MSSTGKMHTQLGRSPLTQETSTRATGTQSYAYDGGTAGGPGNPTSFKGVANTFNSDNQATGSGYGYNGNGNPVYYPGHSLSFDPENRLSGINVGLGTSYAYDGDGLQVVKTVAYFVAGHPGGVGPHTAYTYSYKLYDGTQPVCEYGTSVATTTFGADGLVSRYGSGNTTFFTFDERGNMAQRLDKTAAVVSSDQYDAYGKQTSTAGGDNYGFGAQAGYYTDSSGLILCTHRYYDPNNGRWLTRDPLGYAGGVNLYGYCGNDPGNRWDPTGYNVNIPLPGGPTLSIPIAGIVGGIIGGVAAGVILAGAPVAAAIIGGILLGGAIGAGLGYLGSKITGEDPLQCTIAGGGLGAIIGGGWPFLPGGLPGMGRAGPYGPSQDPPEWTNPPAPQPPDSWPPPPRPGGYGMMPM